MLRRATHSVGMAALTLAAAACAQTIRNRRLVRTPLKSHGPIAEKVSVLMPARNEEGRIRPTLEDLLQQIDLPHVEFLVLNDASTDHTAAIVQSYAMRDSRLSLIEGVDEAPPPGWLGKNWACHRLSQRATGSVLVFVDADVRFRPHAIAASIQMLRDQSLDLLSPYPQMIAETWLERIVQPLVVWSWMSLLPLDAVETKPYASLAAANGQFIAADARAYRVSGGHRGVAANVIEDVGLLRLMKRHGFKGAPANGAYIASCRMYEGRSQLWSGYTKSLWSAFGSPAASVAVVSLLSLTYITPPLLILLGPDRLSRTLGVLGYAAGVTARTTVASATHEKTWPDALAHPVSIAVLTAMTAMSWRGRRAGTLRWRGRPISR